MRTLLQLSLLVTVVFTGCRQNTGPAIGLVKGTVTMDGQPLSGVSISFQPESGRPSFGQTDAGGRYDLKYTIDQQGAVLGQHKVSIAYAEIDPFDPELDRPAGGVPHSPAAQVKIPEKYDAKTELTAEVRQGMNTIDFPLTSR
ncbi:hypothetical protein SH661x_000822 [Planctomicrobium sp. SH661]|uniref:hypothetical protein n=1 Tax=Planctomicrobium sp. SH661 TaxID=3448124 RepID=UPI003F5AE767